MERLTEWDKTHTHGQLVKGDGYTRLAEYEDTGLTPEEIREHEMIFASYRHVCGGKSPEEIKKALELLDAEKQGLLFDVTKQHDIEGTKRIIRCLIENYVGVPVPSELIDSTVDNLVI